MKKRKERLFMIEFRDLQLENMEEIKPFLYIQKSRICDYTIGGLFMWRHYFKTEFCIMEDTLLMKVTYLNGESAFTYPIGKQHKKMVILLQEYCNKLHMKLEFCTVSEEYLEQIKQMYSNLDIQEERDWFDYLYDANSLKVFPGKKYNKVRNHLNKFNTAYKQWIFEIINKDNLNEVIEFYDAYQKHQEFETKTMIEEGLKVQEVLTHYNQYELLGGMLKVDGTVVGFSLGEIVHDTLFIHVEKANIQYHGVYQKLVSCYVSEFAKDEVQYVNREEDVGDEGLRKSKMAYRPIALLKKYTVEVTYDNFKGKTTR